MSAALKLACVYHRARARREEGLFGRNTRNSVKVRTGHACGSNSCTGNHIFCVERLDLKSFDLESNCHMTLGHFDLYVYCKQ